MSKKNITRDLPSADQEELLYDLYYNKKLLFGRDRLYKYIQENYPDSGISRRMVYNWLSRQEVHQIFQQTKRTKLIQHTVLNEPKKQIGVDLVDMQKYEYNGYKYILTCIDLFSKKAYARALKSKEEKEVTKAMEYLIKNEIHYVSSIRSDRGSEFISNSFLDLLKKYDIKSVLSLPAKPESNGNIERFNKTLKRLLRMAILINKTKDWVSQLPIVIDNYNDTENTVTHKTPNELDEEYDKNILEDVEDTISKKVNSRNENDEPKFKKNDKVRIKLSEDEKPSGGENWSKKIYTIYKVLKPRSSISSVSYLIKDKDEKYTKKYYNNDLLYIPAVENKIDEPEKYQISKIIRPIVQNKRACYIVRWKGYTAKDDTTELRKNLLEDVPKEVHKFEKEYDVKWNKNFTKYTWSGEN